MHSRPKTLNAPFEVTGISVNRTHKTRWDWKTIHMWHSMRHSMPISIPVSMKNHMKRANLDYVKHYQRSLILFFRCCLFWLSNNSWNHFTTLCYWCIDLERICIYPIKIGLAMLSFWNSSWYLIRMGIPWVPLWFVCWMWIFLYRTYGKKLLKSHNFFH